MVFDADGHLYVADGADPVGIDTLSVAGQFRPDVGAFVGGALGVTSETRGERHVYVEDGVAPDNVYKAFRLHLTTAGPTAFDPLINFGVRMRPGTGGPEELLLLFDRFRAEGNEGILVRWAPEAPAQTRLGVSQVLPARFYTLVSATPQGGLLQAPILLYNVEDTHFHTVDGLSETALPRALAPSVPASPFEAAYHLVESR